MTERMYKVTATATFKYEFDVMAESQEAAMSKAYTNLSWPGRDETPRELGLVFDDLKHVEVQEAE